MNLRTYLMIKQAADTPRNYFDFDNDSSNYFNNNSNNYFNSEPNYFKPTKPTNDYFKNKDYEGLVDAVDDNMNSVLPNTGPSLVDKEAIRNILKNRK